MNSILEYLDGSKLELSARRFWPGLNIWLYLDETLFKAHLREEMGGKQVILARKVRAIKYL